MLSVIIDKETGSPVVLSDWEAELLEGTEMEFHPVSQEVADAIIKLQRSNSNLSRMIMSASDRLQDTIVPMMVQAFDEGADAQNLALIGGTDNEPVVNPYEEILKKKAEMRGLSSEEGTGDGLG